MLTIVVEFMDGKIKKYTMYESYKLDGNNMVLTSSRGVRVVPLLNVREAYIENN